MQVARVDSDALGNRIDPSVQYARGRILSSSEDEAKRQQHGFDLISSWVSKSGETSVYNLNGVARANLIEPQDLVNLSFFNSIANLRGRAEEVAVQFLGGEPSKHAGLITTRLSSANIIVMLEMVKPGKTVACVTPDGRSHPSVKLGIRLAGGNFVECVGFAGFKKLLDSGQDISTLVVTPITPQIRHLNFEEARKCVDLANEHEIRTYVDDGHAALRVVAYAEPEAMKLDPEVATISSDKHLFGPRAGVTVGIKETISKLRATALEFGFEAQPPALVNVYKALRNHDEGHIQGALKVAKLLHDRLEQEYPGRFYFENDCVAMTDENLIRLLDERSGKKVWMVPQEACSAISMFMLEKYAIVTVSAMAAPGAAPYLRLITWPDGQRISDAKIVEALNYAVGEVCKVATDEVALRRAILGKARAASE